MELRATLTPLPHCLPRTHGFDLQPHYLIIGGLVFTRLCCPMLEDKRSKGHSSAIYDLVHNQIARSFASEQPAEELIILTEVLAAPLNYGYAASVWRVLDTLNGQRPANLRELHKMYATFDSGPFLEFVFSHGGERIVLDVEECRKSEADILKMHAIPSIASEGLADLSAGAA